MKKKKGGKEKSENAFPPDHPFIGHLYAMPQHIDAMQDNLMKQVPTWRRVSLKHLSVENLVELYGVLRAAFPIVPERDSIPICWDWRSVKGQDPILVEANKKQKHECEFFIYFDLKPCRVSTDCNRGVLALAFPAAKAEPIRLLIVSPLTPSTSVLTSDSDRSTFPATNDHFKLS